MTWNVRLDNGVVVEGNHIGGDGFMPASEAVLCGWTYTEEGGFVPPAAPPPKPLALTKVQFIRLAKSAGGMTAEMHVQASEDSNLKEMWLMFDATESGIERDDPDTVAGLQGMAALTYLPNGADAVLAAWPIA